MSTIRGHQAQFKLFKNGELTKVVDLTRFEVNMDASFMRSFYVGAPNGEGDQSVDGWSGSLDLEVRDASVDDVIDSLINGNLNGIGADEFSIVDTEFYPDGTQRTYVYSDVQLKMSKTTPGQTEKVTKRLEFQASVRTAV